MPIAFKHLLSEALRVGDLTQVKMINPFILSEEEVKVRSWVLDSITKYGAPPTLKMLKEHPDFGGFADPSHKGTDLRVLLGNALEYHVNKRIQEIIVECQLKAMESGGKFPLDMLLQATRKAKSCLHVEHDALSTADLDAIFSQKELENGITFGLESLDLGIGMIAPGEILLLAARTGVGKSAIVCHAAAKWASEGKKVLVVSSEMSPAEILKRIFSFLASFNARAFRDVTKKAELEDHKKKAADMIKIIVAGGGDIIFPRERSMNIYSVEAAIAEQEPDVVIIDGVYLLKADTERGAADWMRVKAVSNAIKQMCLEYKLPIMTTTQFKRGNTTGEPDIEDLAYSDALGQDADMIVAMQFDQERTMGHNVILEIIKNRAGEMGGKSQIEIDWARGKVIDHPWESKTIQLVGGVTLGSGSSAIPAMMDKVEDAD